MIGERPDILRISPSEEATQESPVVGGAMRELVVNESCRQQFLAFAAGHKKSKAGRKSLADLAVIAETYRDGGTVLDGGKFGGEFGTNHPKYVGGCGRGQSDDDGIELV